MSYEDDNRTFTIEINKDIGIKELVTTVCHEMVHVKQYARNEMTDELIESGHAVWKGRKIHPKTGYYDLPWEKNIQDARWSCVKSLEKWRNLMFDSVGNPIDG